MHSLHPAFLFGLFDDLGFTALFLSLAFLPLLRLLYVTFVRELRHPGDPSSSKSTQRKVTVTLSNRAGETVVTTLDSDDPDSVSTFLETLKELEKEPDGGSPAKA